MRQAAAAAGAGNVISRRPVPRDVWRAIAVYTRAAYCGEPPSAVRDRLQTLRAVSDEDFYTCAVVEADGDARPWRYHIRLGNQHYPHMRLAIEPSEAPPGYAFAVDTHDGHFPPPASAREHKELARLREANRRTAERIERAFIAAGLPTVRSGAAHLARGG